MSTAKPTVLFYFTEQYPFGLGEAFVAAELNALCEKFSEVYIFPLSGSGAQRNLPKNANVQSPKMLGNNKVNRLLASRKISGLVKSEEDLVVQQLPNPAEQKAYAWQAIQRAEQIDALARSIASEVVFYSFWMNNWALALTHLVRQKAIPRYICRVNGYDLYNERRSNGYVPFRALNTKHAGHVLTTSAFAASYLKEQQPAEEEKVGCLYLGTPDCGLNTSTAPRTIIFSCGWLRPVTRVERIAEAFLQLPDNWHWWHAGDGPERKKIENLLDSNAQKRVRLLGNLPHDELQELLRTAPIAVVVHTSESEGGAPVALMEAISYGLPVVATNVGGVPEIVNAETGTLLSAAAKPNEIANALEAVLSNSELQKALAVGARKHWEQLFNAEHSSKQLLELLCKTDKQS